MRLPRGPGGAAGLDGPAGAPLSRAAPGGRGERGLPSPPQGAPGSARVSAGRARGAGSPVQALRGAHHRGDVRAGPHRPRAPVLLRTGPEPPGPVPRVPPEQNGLEFSHATTLESRFSRRAYEAYVESPRLPPLVFKLNSHKPERICHGIDVVRCRKNALAHSKFPAPIFCPKDNMEQAREGHLADLTYVKLPEDGHRATFPRLPTWARAGTPSPRRPTCLKRASRPGATSRGAWTPRRTWTRSP